LARTPHSRAFFRDLCVSAVNKDPDMKAEKMLAELNRLRKDLGEDKSDIEWLTLHHAFCFLSYKMGDFQKYLDEQARQGAFEEFQE
jgi:hypothetical protein